MFSFIYVILSFFGVFDFSFACKPRPPGDMAVMYTPYDTQGKLNLAIIPKYIDYLYKGGIREVQVNAPVTGDAPITTLSEAKKIFKAVVDEAKPKNMTVFCHLGGKPLSEARELAKYACEIGASGVVALASSIIKPNTSTNLVTYLSIIADAANPCLMYYDDEKRFNGVNINMIKFFPEATRKIKNFGGIFTQLQVALQVQSSGKLTSCQALYVHNPFIIFDVYAHGLNGSVTPVSSIFPKLTSSISQDIANRNYAQALATQRKINAVLIPVFKFINNDRVDSTLFPVLASLGRSLFILVSKINVGYRAPISPILGLSNLKLLGIPAL